MFPRMREAYRGNPLSASYSAALSGPAKQYWADLLHKSTYCMQLFPGRSAAHMDAIFGEDARHEAFSPLNGLFVHSNVRLRLEPQIGKSAVGFGPLRQLDGWRLQFLSDFRPSPRYVWWLYLRVRI